jgi:DNA-binding MurR/RpiR family transcriptional regulator
MPESFTNSGDFRGAAVFEGSTINNTGQIAGTIINENPETLNRLFQAYKEIGVSEEKRRQAEATAEELAAKLGFTSAAVIEFFRILGEQHVPEEKLKDRLVEIATHFTTTREVLATLEPDDPRAAELVRQAKDALDDGQLAEADALLGQTKELEAAALGQAEEVRFARDSSLEGVCEPSAPRRRTMV